jgi:acyl-CoA thioester hydrolase
MDGDGTVNNAHYFEFFEHARLGHPIALGIVVRPRPAGASRPSFTIAETSCRYVAPLRHPDRIAVQAWSASIGNRSFALDYRIEAPPDRTLVADCSSALVWLDDDGRAAALPEDVRAALEASLA